MTRTCCTHWTGSNGEFRYNVIIKFVTYLTRTIKTNKQNKKKMMKKLPAYMHMHNVALTLLVTCF